MRNNRLIIYFAIILHLTWGIGLLFSHERVATTALFSLYELFPSTEITGAILIMASLSSIIGIYFCKKYDLFKSTFFFLLQQILIATFLLTQLKKVQFSALNLEKKAETSLVI